MNESECKNSFRFVDTLGKRIKHVRRVRRGGLTQQDLADIIGVSRGAVGNWERDQDKPSRENVIRFKSELDINPDWLLRNVGAPPSLTDNDFADDPKQQ